MPTLPDDPTEVASGAGGQWEAAAPDLLRFVAFGDLDIDVRREVAATLFEVRPGSAPRVEIDLSGATFLDAGTAGVFARYADEAARHGGAERVVNVIGLPRYVLRLLGLTHLLADRTHPSDEDRPIPRRPIAVADVIAVSRAVTAASGEIVARSQALCRMATRYRKR